MALWLATVEGVITHNLRDVYTAGGQGQIRFKGKLYTEVPMIIMQLIENLENIKKVLSTLEHDLLLEYWKHSIPLTNIYSTWVNLILTEADGTTNFPLEEFLMSNE